MRQRNGKSTEHVSFRPWPEVRVLLKELRRFPYVSRSWAVNSTLRRCLPAIIKDLNNK